MHKELHRYNIGKLVLPTMFQNFWRANISLSVLATVFNVAVKQLKDAFTIENINSFFFLKFMEL